MSGALLPDQVDRAQSWRRLSPRMLLVHPVQQVMQFLPALFGVVILGRANDGMPWWFEIVFVAIPVLLGISRWFTTSYTIGQDTIRLRTGLLQRKTLTANLERVRTVDAVAPPLHRLLGLAKVMIGTGADKPFELNGLRAAEARSLRTELLHRGVGPVAARPTPVRRSRLRPLIHPRCHPSGHPHLTKRRLNRSHAGRWSPRGPSPASAIRRRCWDGFDPPGCCWLRSPCPGFWGW